MKFAIAAYVIGFLIIATSLYGIQKSVRLSTWGVETDVKATKFFKTQDKRGSTQKIQYTFVTQNGVEIQSTSSIGDDLEHFKGPLKVVYLPTDPEVNELSGFSLVGFYPALLIGVLIMLLGRYFQKRDAAQLASEPQGQVG